MGMHELGILRQLEKMTRRKQRITTYLNKTACAAENPITPDHIPSLPSHRNTL